MWLYVVFIINHFIEQHQVISCTSSPCKHALISGSYDNCQTVLTTKTDLWQICESKDCEDITILLKDIGGEWEMDDANTQVNGGLKETNHNIVHMISTNLVTKSIIYLLLRVCICYKFPIICFMLAYCLVTTN